MNSKSVINCHNALNSISTHNTVKVMWIDAHVGHWGNKEADKLAKAGTQGEEPCKGYLPPTYIKHAINTKVRDECEESWSKPTHRHTRLTLASNSKTIKKDINKLLNNRGNYRAAVHLITGCAGLNYHLYKIKAVDTKTCPHCEYAEETVGHCIGQCPAFALLRGEFFNTYCASLSDIFENHSILSMVNYVAKTKRFLFHENRDQSGIT